MNAKLHDQFVDSFYTERLDKDKIQTELDSVNPDDVSMENFLVKHPVTEQSFSKAKGMPLQESAVDQPVYQHISDVEKLRHMHSKVAQQVISLMNLEQRYHTLSKERIASCIVMALTDDIIGSNGKTYKAANPMGKYSSDKLLRGITAVKKPADDSQAVTDLAKGNGLNDSLFWIGQKVFNVLNKEVLIQQNETSFTALENYWK